jgi:hypothetical protein
MTESEWGACTEPRRMLRFLLGTDHPRIADVEAFPACRASDRKLRLFACACYGRVRHLLPDALAEAAVVVAERFAEGLATAEELQGAFARLQEALVRLEGRWRASRGAKRTALRPRQAALALAFQATRLQAPKAAYYASSNAYLAAASIRNPGVALHDSGFCASQSAEERAQTDLLRDIIGPLLFRPVRLDAAWLSGTVVQLARAIYEERRWDDMGVLGDALQEAGCTDADVLEHCRGTAHTRGCWVVDLLLNKE